MWDPSTRPDARQFDGDTATGTLKEYEQHSSDTLTIILSSTGRKNVLFTGMFFPLKGIVPLKRGILYTIPPKNTMGPRNQDENHNKWGKANLPICKRFVKPHVAAGHESSDGYSTTLTPKRIPAPAKSETPFPSMSPQQNPTTTRPQPATCTKVQVGFVRRFALL